MKQLRKFLAGATAFAMLIWMGCGAVFGAEISSSVDEIDNLGGQLVFLETSSAPSIALPEASPAVTTAMQTLTPPQNTTTTIAVTTDFSGFDVFGILDHLRETTAATTSKTTTTTMATTTTTTATTTTTSTTSTTTTTKTTTTSTSTTTTKTTTTTVTTQTTTTTKLIYNGIDVSYHQGTIDWAKVKKSGNVDFAIIRAGYGRDRDPSQVDKKFHENIAAAKAQGIPVGTYWYSYATTPEEARQEAQYCLDTIRGYQFEYPVYFDIEEPKHEQLSAATVSAIVEAFCSTVEASGYYVGVYSYASFLNTKVYVQTLKKYDIWVAHTNVDKPNYNLTSYGIWQYSFKGRIDGISGDVDLDQAYKNYPVIMKNNKLNGFK